MMIGLNKQLQIDCKCSKNAVIASQSADWRGNPFPSAQTDFTEILRNLQPLGYGLPRRFAPRNDSAGQIPVTEICVLTKTDSQNHNFDVRLR